jgi:hypothetical protein
MLQDMQGDRITLSYADVMPPGAYARIRNPATFDLGQFLVTGIVFMLLS